MTQAYKCDKCGALYENGGTSISGKVIRMLCKGKETWCIELCPICSDTLKQRLTEWWGNLTPRKYKVFEREDGDA